MRAARRLADWARHAGRREVAITVAVLALCAGVVLAAGAGNSGKLTTRAGNDAAAAAGAAGTAADVAPGTTSTEAAATVRHRARKARAHRRAARHHRRSATTRRHRRRSQRAAAKGGSGSSGTGLASGGRGSAKLPVAAQNAPVVLGADVLDGTSTDRFFRQYSVSAGSADGGAAVRAVADWINARGGISGHKVQLRTRSFDFYGSPVSVQDEATCATWASGDKPIADIDAHASTDILIPCLRKHGIATFVNGTTPPVTADFQAPGAGLYSPGSPALDRVQTAYVRGLADAGFFPRKARIGLLLSTNLPQLSSAGAALKQALKAEGVQVDEVSEISLEDPVSFFASEASAILHFRIAKIDHVIALDQDGLAFGQFMRGAEAEGYRPVYGVSSADAPAFLAAGSSPKQLRGAIGVGWSPLLDVQASDDPGGGATRATCAQIFSGAGVDTGGRTPFGQYAVYQACDSMLALRAAGAVDAASLASGMNALGQSWQSGINLGTSIGPGNHDGTAAWRLLRYGDGCHCFRYDGPVRGM